MANRKYSPRETGTLSSHAEQESERSKYFCCAKGCRLRATCYPGQIKESYAGYCMWHAMPGFDDRSEQDISDRYQKYRDLALRYERLRDARIVFDSNKKYRPAGGVWYHERMPVKPDEHHHEWVDRARKYLVRLIVEMAAKKTQSPSLDYTSALREIEFGEVA